MQDGEQNVRHQNVDYKILILTEARHHRQNVSSCECNSEGVGLGVDAMGNTLCVARVNKCQ